MMVLSKYKAVLSSFIMICLVMLISACQRRQADHFTSDDRFAAFTPSKDLEADFKNPPDQARPWAFWWWLEGNIDSAGILKDLSEMKKAGLAGALIYDAGSSSYTDVFRTPPGPQYMGVQWRDMFKYAAKVADSLHLQISLNITSGWNDGGPWVTPDDAAKKLTWSELKINGPAEINQKIPLPGNVFISKKDSTPYFKPVAALAIPLADSSPVVTPLKYFDLKAIHRVSGISNGNGYDWNIFLQEDSATLDQYSAKLKDVIDISRYVDSAGNIHWQVPQGAYSILWFGYTCTGAVVSTSSPGGEGLAIDYMSDKATDLQFEKVPAALINEVKPFVGKSLKYLHDDSWELGAANWTPGFVQEFKKRRGYDPLPYLPVIAGKILENKDVSNRFLYDFRRTVADLIAENHYQRLKTLAHQYGLGVHPESGGPHPAPIDALMNMGIDDVPMGEFWAKVKTHRVQDYQRIFIKQGASAAHTYGRRYVQAEGPTSIGPQWEMDPFHLKPTIDRVFCEGMNRLVFHTFTHSPDSVGKPGYEYFAGTHFNPNITWWEMAPAYTKYVARCQELLQQGSFIGDVCFYYGDNVPNQVHLKRIDPSLGEGYDYDFVDTRILLDSMYVKDHRIFLNDGMHYEVLVLPDRQAIPLPVLKKIRQLVHDGATVIGPRPEHSVGLSGYPQAEREVKKIASEIWGELDGKTRTENDYHKGKIVWGKTIRQVLAERKVIPDFTAEGKKQLQDVDYIHRRFGDDDIYFVCNWRDRAQWFTADFRVTGKAPALWHPDNGNIFAQKVYSRHDGYTSVPLYLPAYGSVFVVFRTSHDEKHIESIQRDGKQVYPFQQANAGDIPYFVPTAGNKLAMSEAGNYSLHFSDNSEREISIPSLPADSIKGAWKVAFDTAWGGPASTTFGQLVSWPESADVGIKYYSGTAVYRNTFDLEAGELNDHTQIRLNLGTVFNLASVKVNGHDAGILWKEPFSLDISAYAKQGVNTLEIKVVNLWPNRLIGDQSLPPARRYTHTNVIKFTKDDPLRPSGLLGPVTIEFKPLISAH